MKEYDIIFINTISIRRGGGIMNEESNTRPNLYIDIDSTIINTAETFIDMYCKKKGINKNFYDLKDWKFRSIDRNIDVKEFLN